MLKAILTDVDGTLYHQPMVRRYMTRRLIEFTARRPVAGWRTMRVLRAYRAAQERLRRDPGPGAALRQTAHAVRQTGYDERFVADCVRQWMEKAPLPSLRAARYPHVGSFCSWASEHGLKRGVLSDYDPRQKLRALGLEQYFPVIVCAQDRDVGVFKPNPEGLFVALRRLGVEPKESVYVGDRPDVDGALASAAGVPGILVPFSSRSPCPPGVETAADWFEVRVLITQRLST